MDIDVEYKDDEESQSVGSPSVSNSNMSREREPVPVTLEAQDVEMLMNVIEEAAKRLRGQNPDMAQKMMSTIDHVAKRVKVVEKHERKPIPKKVTFSLGQIVEVKCHSQDGVVWMKGKIVSGSGGGLFSVELGKNEVWDRISSNDLRPLHDNKGVPQFALSQRVQASYVLTGSTDKLLYSGWVYATSPDSWFGRSKTKLWAMVIDTSLYHGLSPNSRDWTVKKLLSSKVTPNSAEKSIQITNEDYSYSIVFQLLCAYEFEVWLEQLRSAAERAKKKPDPALLTKYEKNIINHHKRGLVPLFEPGAQPENNDKAKSQGYLIQRSGELSSFISGTNWKRRWVTLHSCYMTVRTDRSSVSDLEIIPLREVELTVVKGEDRILSLVGPFITNFYIWCDNDSMMSEWRGHILTAIVASNPEHNPSSRVKSDDSDKTGIM